jgi:hypothetical protein
MKDLLEKILGYLPSYLGDLVQLVTRPKRFIAERNNDETHREGTQLCAALCCVAKRAGLSLAKLGVNTVTLVALVPYQCRTVQTFILS